MNVILPIGEKRIPKHGDENAISVCGEYMGCPPCEKRIPKHGDENAIALSIFPVKLVL